MSDDDFGKFWDPEELARAEAQRQQGKFDTKGMQPKPNGACDTQMWPDPDTGVLRLRRRDPPELPIKVFGPEWGGWIVEAAAAAACPPDYVAMPLLASTSALIGNARWAQAVPGWAEPPHEWVGVVGDSGDGKSPGSDCLIRYVLPEIERRMIGDFPERHYEWQRAVDRDKAAVRQYEEELRAAQRSGDPSTFPEKPKPTASEVEPQLPRMRQSDTTIEQVAMILATAARKGVVVVRDELAGWLLGMNAYNPSGRQFWIEAYGGRPYRLERRKHGTQPIDIPHHVVAVYGGTQPEKLAELMGGADDGLLSRIDWSWPEYVPFKLGRETPRIAWAIEALDRLRELDLKSSDPPSPIFIPLTAEGQNEIEKFACEMQGRRLNAGGLLRSAFGKARGKALRTALVLEFLWWCAKGGMEPPPSTISLKAFAAAAIWVSDYLMPMAERVYGDAAATEVERNAATLARWIVKEQPEEVHVRHLQRTVRLNGLRSAEEIRKAADMLVDADWLQGPPKSVFAQSRGRVAYPVNPKVKGVVP